MKHIWTVLCSRMVTDRDTNSVSLQNVLETLTVRDHPQEDSAISVEMTVATMWMRDDPDEGEAGFQRVTLKSPSGKVLGQWEADVDLGEYLRVRYKLVVRGLPVPEAGIYTFTVDGRGLKQQRWKKAAHVPLVVAFDPPDSEEE